MVDPLNILQATVAATVRSSGLISGQRVGQVSRIPCSAGLIGRISISGTTTGPWFSPGSDGLISNLICRRNASRDPDSDGIARVAVIVPVSPGSAVDTGVNRQDMRPPRSG